MLSVPIIKTTTFMGVFLRAHFNPFLGMCLPQSEHERLTLRPALPNIDGMKALLQRVSAASVIVGQEEVGRIGPGLCVLVGIAMGDRENDADRVADKMLALRIFADEAGKFNHSVLDVKGGVLLVSQFTLLADTRRGRRPSFTEAAPPAEAARLFEYFVARTRTSGLEVATGRFQEHMHLEIHNDGPVTIMLES